MSPNDILAQQQTLLNQAMQGQQQIMQTQQGWMWIILTIQIIFLLVGGWVVYMFYARLRDIAEELMKLRIAYQFANQSRSDAPKRAPSEASLENPFLTKGEDRFKPK